LPGFADRCLDAWKQVVAACAVRPWVLEGVAFQNTVRFMFEQELPDQEICAYWERFVAIVRDVDPLLVHLRPGDVRGFIREHTTTVRSHVWDKISAHVLRTPAGRRLDAEGAEAPVEFWVQYNDLCERLFDGCDLSKVVFDVARHAGLCG
jgi:hypothetical protein